MFQTFEAPDSLDFADQRLAELRSLMGTLGITMVLVPHNDEQNNEYLPADKERLAWISGFTGSAGSALITSDQAVLFVDGRYTLQAAEQADSRFWTVESLIDLPPGTWIAKNAQNNDRVGFDPWLHTAAQVRKLKEAAETCGCTLIELPANPIDQIWQEQPAPSTEPVRIHDLCYSGRLTRDKHADLQNVLTDNRADLCILVDPASSCWLFNIRGGDVAHTPITLAHTLLIKGQEPLLFVDEKKLDMETRAYLTQVCTIKPPEMLAKSISELSPKATVMIDETTAPFAFNKLVKDAAGTVLNKPDPVALMRATKNAVELQGSREAHRRDGASMISFLCWLDAQPAGTIDEITAAKRLEQFRAEMAGNMPLRDISFDTISGSGPNGAIVHYRVNESSNRSLNSGELYLNDSGGQYDDGTTDITRTIAIGEPDSEKRRAYTLVLKGHIAIATARFPKGTRGVDIDALARMALWQNGMDYTHGTGHGVGSYLAVHEGPQNISRRGMQEFLPGMIISNEPGYYRAGAFGIRIENLIVVHEEAEIEGGDQPMLGFETITLAPLDRRLIDPHLLTDAELHWLNAYHGRVLRDIEPMVNQEAADWLRWATEPLVKDLPPASA
ncbi:MAG: aminopeptidase P family protein [Rhizobiaceae bacterium]